MPPKDLNEGQPQMVAVGSPEFNSAVQEAVRAALLQSPMPQPEPRTVATQTPAIIPQTPIDLTKPGKDDLTVRFLRFCEFQNSGYQRGQEAGFPRQAAMDLVASRAATIAHDPRTVRAA